MNEYFIANKEERKLDHSLDSSKITIRTLTTEYPIKRSNPPNNDYSDFNKKIEDEKYINVGFSFQKFLVSFCY